MGSYGWLILYSLAVVVASVAGGWLPFLGRLTHSKLQFYLSASAGVMLGASFFHVMPEAMELSQGLFGWWMSLGVVGLFCIERFIAPHSHELDAAGSNHNHKHEHDHEHCGHEHGQGPGKVIPLGKEPRAAAPAVAGWMAVLALTIHTFMNGVGLAGAVIVDANITWFPGLMMFLAIVLHKPFDALAITTVLTRRGVSRQRVSMVLIGFALTVALGVGAFCLAQKRMDDAMRSQFTGAALAFSAGTFLFVALSDLLPEVQFHRHDRVPLFLTLTAGVAFMGLIALLEGHEHAHDEHGDHDKPGLLDKGQEGDHSDKDGHDHKEQKHNH